MAIFEEFAIFSQYRVCHLAKPRHRELSTRHFLCRHDEVWFGDVDARQHCLLHNASCSGSGIVPPEFFVPFVLGDIIWPRAGGPVFPPVRGYTFNLHRSVDGLRGAGPRAGGPVFPPVWGHTFNLHWSVYNLQFGRGCLTLSSTSQYATIIHRRDMHPWKWWRRVFHPWRWYCSMSLWVSAIFIS